MHDPTIYLNTFDIGPRIIVVAQATSEEIGKEKYGIHVIMSLNFV